MTRINFPLLLFATSRYPARSGCRLQLFELSQDVVETILWVGKKVARFLVGLFLKAGEINKALLRDFVNNWIRNGEMVFVGDEMLH